MILLYRGTDNNLLIASRRVYITQLNRLNFSSNGILLIHKRHELK